ncbi:MAG: helix-turn-helix domain-containing protein [Chloroflexota bacterium]|nr:helix-turn-helix domain-containing protein [Chloroflexota bacterium]
MSDAWRAQLREVRKRLGLTQQRLGELSDLSVDAIRGYERGQRSPRREHLTAILDGLQLEHAERRAILEGAGFVADARSDGADMAPFWHTTESAESECDRHGWPAFVTDEFARVVSANQAAQRLWGVDLTREFLDPVERNLLSLASDPRFADRCLNWEEFVGTILAVFKAHDWAPGNIEDPPPYFGAVFERFMKGDAKYVGRFFALWEATSADWGRKERWGYPVVWKDPECGVMRFDALTSIASMDDGLAFNDWHPVDAETWRVLELVKARSAP